MSLEAFAVSTGVVALGEVGDKTQLLALLLAARFRKPLPIIAGILVATLLNHAGASALGAWLTRVVDPHWMRWALGLSFLGVAAWMLIPDQADDAEGHGSGRLGVFGVTTIAFFLAEMGDKTQIATVMLAAKYQSLVVVTAGTTLGMMIANVPAVLIGDKAVKFVPIVWVHRIAAVVFAGLGLAVLAGIGGGLSGHGSAAVDRKPSAYVAPRFGTGLDGRSTWHEYVVPRDMPVHAPLTSDVSPLWRTPGKDGIAIFFGIDCGQSFFLTQV